MTPEQKQLYIANGNLHWFIELYDDYRKTTDKPDFANFMNSIRPK